MCRKVLLYTTKKVKLHFKYVLSVLDSSGHLVLDVIMPEPILMDFDSCIGCVKLTKEVTFQMSSAGWKTTLHLFKLI